MRGAIERTSDHIRGNRGNHTKTGACCDMRRANDIVQAAAAVEEVKAS